MKNILLFIFLISTLGQAQKGPSVKVIARSLPEKVLLRWAVDEPLAWKKANELGFIIERSIISRNGEAVIPIKREQLTNSPLKPKQLEAWENLAANDQNAAVLAQALYGDSFKTEAPSNAIGRIYAVNEELEQRFTFALLAAEQNFEAAKLAGWAFEDNTIKPGEKYVYKISVSIPFGNETIIKEGTVYAGNELYEKLPQPIGLSAVFGDENVMLNWNFNLLQQLYTSYTIERSSNSKDFEQLNAVPLFNAQEAGDSKEISLFYTDSIPNNIAYSYRVKGKTAFGETGPATEPLTGKAVKNLGFVPKIIRKEIPTSNTVILYWAFDEKGNDQITNFEIRRANSDKGNYQTIKRDLPVTTRQTTLSNLKRVNYYTVVAMGKNNVESESFPMLVQPVDSIPPAPPAGLNGVIDTTRLVELTWNKNLEEDLSGYRVFKSYNPKQEFTEVTRTTLFENTFTDTVSVKNLNQKIYYKLIAEDKRYNRSEFSAVLEVKKPDMLAPSPPVLKNYEITKSGVQLQWIASSSNDVKAHKIYRRAGNEQNSLWQELFETEQPLDSIYLDNNIQEPNRYSYTVTAVDQSGLESTPTDALTLTWRGNNLEANELRLTGTANRELRFINLSWGVKRSEVLEYYLYRGSNENDLKLYKTLDGNVNGYNDSNLEINSSYNYGLQILEKSGQLSEIKKLSVKY